MPDLAVTLITLGSLLLIGFVADGLGKRTRLPRVTLLLVMGFLIGPYALNLLPDLGKNWFNTVTHMALVMVSFLLGGKLTGPLLAERGRQIMWVSLSVVVLTALVEWVGLFAAMTMGVVVANLASHH